MYFDCKMEIVDNPGLGSTSALTKLGSAFWPYIFPMAPEIRKWFNFRGGPTAQDPPPER